MRNHAIPPARKNSKLPNTAASIKVRGVMLELLERTEWWIMSNTRCKKTLRKSECERIVRSTYDGEGDCTAVDKGDVMGP